MKKQGNHMVDLPQPELDTEEECDHSYPYDLLDVHDYDETTIVFEVRCPDCGKIGFVEGSVTILQDVDWDYYE